MTTMIIFSHHIIDFNLYHNLLIEQFDFLAPNDCVTTIFICIFNCDRRKYGEVCALHKVHTGVHM